VTPWQQRCSHTQGSRATLLHLSSHSVEQQCHTQGGSLPRGALGVTWARHLLQPPLGSACWQPHWLGSTLSPYLHGSPWLRACGCSQIIRESERVPSGRDLTGVRVYLMMQAAEQLAGIGLAIRTLCVCQLCGFCCCPVCAQLMRSCQPLRLDTCAQPWSLTRPVEKVSSLLLSYAKMVQ
jgi:hypothetical protein